MRVYAELHGGLGNQFSTLAAAFCVARINNLPLTVSANQNKETENSDQIIDAEIVNFDLSEIESTLKEFNLIAHKFSISAKILRIRAFFSKKFKKSSYLFAGDLLINGRARDLTRIRYLTSHYEGVEFPILARNLGFPEKIIALEQSDQYQKIRNSLEDLVVIGIHVRLGDFINWHNGLFLTSIKYYQKAICEALTKYPNSHLILFSDQPIEAEEFLGDKRIRNISKEMSLSTIDEFILLSNCDVIINSKSSFSWWASYFASEKTIIYSPNENSTSLGWNFISET